MAELITKAGLLFFLSGAVITDIRARKIPNILVGAGVASGLLLALLPQGIGLLDALSGMGVGLACLLPLYIFRAMGAGDVKLMAMVGAFLGPRATFEAVLWVLVAGGVLALVFAAKRGVLRKMLGNVATLFYSAAASVQTHSLPDLSQAPSSAKLPYAVAIAAGVVSFVTAREFGFRLF